MLLDLKRVFAEEGACVPFRYGLDLSSVEIGGVFPFRSPVSVRGTARHRDGFVSLETAVSFSFSVPCDRCLKPITEQYDFLFSHTLVSSQESEENDDFIRVENDRLDLDELIRADILLELPTKHLCSETCRGLCPVCGKNRNTGACGCDLHQIDPRLAALKKLID